MATGRDKNGGYAELMTVDERFAYPIPESFSNEQAAPLLCAGAIGYRSLRLAELKAGQHLALSGFGASGHLVLKTAKFISSSEERRVGKSVSVRVDLRRRGIHKKNKETM